MAISSLIIQPVTGSITMVSQALSAISGVTVHSVSPKQEIVILVEAASLTQVNEVARTLEAIPGVLGVFPAYITTADEQEDRIS